MRGGGESGSNDWRNSVGAQLEDLALTLAGWEMATGSGNTNITAVVREGLLWWQQDIEQLATPLPL
jgi:hypothetical protein